MGVVERDLIETKISNVALKVELNDGNIIHFHYGATRFEMKLEEFKELQELCKKAKQNLIEVKKIE
jgi:hypothetical protein